MPHGERRAGWLGPTRVQTFRLQSTVQITLAGHMQRRENDLRALADGAPVLVPVFGNYDTVSCAQSRSPSAMPGSDAGTG